MFLVPRWGTSGGCLGLNHAAPKKVNVPSGVTTCWSMSQAPPLAEKHLAIPSNGALLQKSWLPGTPYIGDFIPARISSASGRNFPSSIKSPVKQTKSGERALVFLTIE